MEATPHPNPLPSGGERGQDTGFMRRAIDLARAQLGRTWPNPTVGCVIVRDGVIIAEAATGDGGRPHAEEQALKLAGDAARGATAYVTLEPCGERSSGASSCSHRLIEAGMARVVLACADPSPYAAQQGVLRMEAAGVVVEAGLLADEAAPLIAGFVHYLATGLPLLRLGTDGVDAMFEAAPDSDLEAELRACAAHGYRTLGVAENSDLAAALLTGGWLTNEVKI
ncbi:bifunctional diaminohydroxyphosphoribosylaminopyrimidine deaminase/5-amino-6-(5-phosphoribosylamino)uracil reductase RibD [Asticcacaulis sp. EMRT-3]|uniref:bifunctional diaminohydroxyphosphoribosylaminopyrimidine deaminase/5-amino-6-(5-phosphoribosylamino)uracil reductase RibD n=1 Tax=Asticcacaulis sp. EMRT-3 TaxID=3040349 RepID=UPI0032C240CB